ncbi:DUF3467 domain-containing protein [Thermocrinis minervae]|uniref:Uncharacterized protein n=1 Tax=Thermocrinis minervae TaxID=381751 RepID=A0A1M6SLQ0_9AQUI|nr:DUF3467 domain-containing protein [Thermocrinis minervae]SHK45633.1 Protein of unknown function [Thermocrinis minervae]
MKNPFKDLTRYIEWKERFLEDYGKIREEDLKTIEEDIRDLFPNPERRLLLALRSMYLGGMEKRVEDEEIRRWTNFAGVETYRTFNSFPHLSDLELAFVFYAIGKIFVPLLLHERGVKSESFKRLSKEDQEKAVMDELDVIWENHLIRVLQILPYLDLNSTSN